MSFRASRGDLCFVLVHGTKWWFGRTLQRWYDAGGELQRQLHAAFPQSPVMDFCWSGANSHGARHAAAIELVRQIDRLRSRFRYIVLIAHSHGGTVALQAAQFSAGDDLYLITLGTPFLEVRAERHVERIGVLIVLLFFLPLMTSAVSFAYFAEWFRISEATGKALISGIALLAFASIFYFLIVKIGAHERLGSWLGETAARLRESCRYTAVRYPVRMLVLYYATDEFRKLSSVTRAIADCLRPLAASSHVKLENVMRWFNPLYFALWILAQAMLALFAIYFLQSWWLIYLVISLLAVTLVYVIAVAFAVVPPFAVVFANELIKFKLAGFSIASVSPIENLLISVRTGFQPVLEVDGLPVSIEPMAVSRSRYFPHTYIGFDPAICERIVRWVSSTVGPFNR